MSVCSLVTAVNASNYQHKKKVEIDMGAHTTNYYCTTVLGDSGAVIIKRYGPCLFIYFSYLLMLLKGSALYQLVFFLLRFILRMCILLGFYVCRKKNSYISLSLSLFLFFLVFSSLFSFFLFLFENI